MCVHYGVKALSRVTSLWRPRLHIRSSSISLQHSDPKKEVIKFWSCCARDWQMKHWCHILIIQEIHGRDLVILDKGEQVRQAVPKWSVWIVQYPTIRPEQNRISLIHSGCRDCSVRISQLENVPPLERATQHRGLGYNTIIIRVPDKRDPRDVFLVVKFMKMLNE